MHGAAGLEAWAGTPGTVGGAVFGNAHFGGRLIGDLVAERARSPTRDGATRDVSGGGDGVRLRSQPAAGDRRSAAVGDVPRVARRSGGAARDGARVARVSQAHAAARHAERRLRLPEPGARSRRRARRHAVVGRRARRSGRTEGRACRRGARLADARQFHRQRRARDGGRHPPADRAVPRARCASGSASSCAKRSSISGSSMSTLLIEGGRRLSGAVEVEGNKNAALPLLAACLLTTDECVLHNVPRISDVEVMARLLIDLGARSTASARTTLRVRCPEVVKDEPDARAGRPAARLGAAARSAARAARRARGSRRPAATFRRAGRSRRISRRSSRWARASSTAGPRARGAGRPEADVDLSLRSVGDRHRDGAARRGRRARASRRSATPRASRTSSSCASSCSKLGVGISGIGTTTIRVEGGGTLHGAEHRLWGDYIEAGSWAVVAAITGGEIDVRGARPEDMEVVAAVLKRLNVECAMDGDIFRVERSKPKAAGPDHDRTVAGVPERSRQPGDGAGDAGRGPDAGARLAVRAAAVRARADERR